ncbi:potassium channel family protein [Heyndrickxia sp. NPDC080065]|uniref:potassium channel family protein n=1 Tax=Heyndrickxia sp. NPDC080065 TaxID=3390568 RepID=UPI003CFE06FC
MKKQYAVIGLGRFGSAIAKALYSDNNDVLGIDIREERIEENQDIVSHAMIADSTEEGSLKNIGIRNFDTVIVSIGDNMQASILTVVILNELGVKHIVAKALNKHHGIVLSKVGATEVVFPERDMGLRIAHKLMSPNIIDYIEISKEYSIEEMRIPSRIVGKSLIDLNIRAKYNVNVIAIRHDNGELEIAPDPNFTLSHNDKMIVIGKNKDIKGLADFKD